MDPRGGLNLTRPEEGFPMLENTLHDEKKGQTMEALADVDAGRTTDHQAIQAWAESLSTDTPLPVPS